MQKSQADRRVIASRVTVKAHVPGRPGTDLTARQETVVAPGGNFGVRRTRVATHGRPGSGWELSMYAPRGGWH